jgi:hypothetical protein
MNKVQKIMSVIILAVAVALPTTAQMFDAGSSPVIAFQSTSTMTGSGSAYSSSPTLDEDGMATYSGASSGPRRVSSSPGTPTTPGAGEKENQFPLGDGILPLMLMALLLGGWIALRQKKQIK